MNIKKNQKYIEQREKFLARGQDIVLLKDTFNIINKIKVHKDREILLYYKRKNILRTNVIVQAEEIDEALLTFPKDAFFALKELKVRVNAIARKELKLISKRSSLQSNEYFQSTLCKDAFETVGIYIPENLPSSLLFYCELARIAGVKNIIIAVPPHTDGKINPALLAAASLCRIHKIIAVGGRGAFPALAFGVGELIPNKLFGPCSFYVDHVKQILSTFYKVPIDIPSGPSEILLFADTGSNIMQIEYDIRAQMEHGSDSICFLVSTNTNLLQEISNRTKDIEAQVYYLHAQDYLQAIEIINEIAPEILEIFSNNSDEIVKGLKDVANVYVNMCSPIGDYCVTGKGCADPTFGMARGISGITIESFFKTSCISYAKKSPLIKNSFAVKLAELEKFQYHKLALETYFTQEK